MIALVNRQRCSWRDCWRPRRGRSRFCAMHERRSWLGANMDAPFHGADLKPFLVNAALDLAEADEDYQAREDALCALAIRYANQVKNRKYVVTDRKRRRFA